jgi:hypothetical protein
MKQKHLIQIDAMTGEVLEGTVAFYAPKRKNGFKKGWIAMEQNNSFRALAQANLSNLDRKVWAIMMSYVGYENEIREPLGAMAEKIGTTRQNFSSSLKKLCDEGIFIRKKRNGRTVQIWLNPEYGWKGTAKNHVVAPYDARKNRGSK